MKLRQTKSVCMLDHHHRGVRHVNPDLHHRRGHQQVNLPGLEGRHRPLLLIRFHPAVQQADLEPAKFTILQPLCALQRRSQVGLLRFFHQRIHDIGLPTGQELVAGQLIGFPPLGLTEEQGANRFPSRRKGINDGHIEIPVDRHRQGPGNRCRGED